MTENEIIKFDDRTKRALNVVASDVFKKEDLSEYNEQILVEFLKFYNPMKSKDEVCADVFDMLVDFYCYGKVDIEHVGVGELHKALYEEISGRGSRRRMEEHKNRQDEILSEMEADITNQIDKLAIEKVNFNKDALEFMEKQKESIENGRKDHAQRTANGEVINDVDSEAMKAYGLDAGMADFDPADLVAGTSINVHGVEFGFKMVLPKEKINEDGSITTKGVPYLAMHIRDEMVGYNGSKFIDRITSLSPEEQRAAMIKNVGEYLKTDRPKHITGKRRMMNHRGNVMKNNLGITNRNQEMIANIDTSSPVENLPEHEEIKSKREKRIAYKQSNIISKVNKIRASNREVQNKEERHI